MYILSRMDDPIVVLFERRERKESLGPTTRLHDEKII